MYIVFNRMSFGSSCSTPTIRFAQLRLRERGRQLDAARWQRDRAPAGRGDGISRLDDRFNLLMRAVELHGLLVALGVEPVEEDARTAAQRRPAALERRPGKAAARTEVKPADLRLVLLTDAAGNRQILAHADVVLDVQAGLHGRERSREGRRHSARTSSAARR
jgi:hypothetical protein